MPAAAKHREAIVASAATLFRRHGYSATGIHDILAASGAPRGSLYHYFPRGKTQIAEEAVRMAGARVQATLEGLLARHHGTAPLVRAYARLVAGWMAASDYRDGCPISAVLMELAPHEPAVTEAGRAALSAWAGTIERAIARDGVPARHAAPLSRSVVAMLQGAMLQARVARSGVPLEEAARAVGRMLEAARS